ncbi:unnamed protein product [Dicrocoelium dendriticum]|nr:unnamed protein product [Dicrocoelium dendriticum]
MNVTLRPNRTLLDPNFESYKLSLQNIPQVSFPLGNGVAYDPLLPPLSKQHVQACVHQNCLTFDPFSSCDIYCSCSSGMIGIVHVPENPEDSCGLQSVFIPSSLAKPSQGQPCATLKFPTKHVAIHYDGFNLISFFEILRSVGSLPSWKHLATEQAPLICDKAVLLDAMGFEHSMELHCILAAVTERPNELPFRTNSSYVTYLEWLTFNQEGSNSKFPLTRHRRFVGSSFPDYVSLTRDNQSLHICAEGTFHAVYDSENPNLTVIQAGAVEVKMEESMTLDSNGTSFVLSDSDATRSVSIQWSQSEPGADDEAGMVHVIFDLVTSQIPPSLSLNRDTVQVRIRPESTSEDKPQTLSVIIHSDRKDSVEGEAFTLIEQSLYGFVEPNPMWTIDREVKCLEVHLSKKHTLHWPRLLRDVEIDRSLVKVEQSDHALNEMESIRPEFTATADPVTVEPNELTKPAFNVDQLEEVDFPLDDDSDLTLQRFDANTLKMTHQANLTGHQWLCNVLVQRAGCWPATNAICLRHDVDGIVWLPTSAVTAATGDSSNSDTSPWSHSATLQAFGYVLASKQDHRFVSTPPLMPGSPLPFVAVADSTRRIYVYKQPNISNLGPSTNGVLRRRNTADSGEGRKTDEVVHVARQYVLAVGDDSPIIGFVAIGQPYPACVACTQKNIYHFSLDA